MNYPVATNPLDYILSHVRGIKPLSPEREFALAVEYRKTGDVEAAHELVVSHLPFVVKTAFQYRHYMLPMQDLIQEGTIGLMKAVKRFDPYKGYRLVSFAVWWIKAYIKNFILSSWNLVKLGTTQAQRKLFFRIGDIGEHSDEASKAERVKKLAEELKVKTDEVIEVQARMKAREWSLNDTVGEDRDLTAMELLEDPGPDQEELLMERQSEQELSRTTRKALKKLDSRERFIITKRFMDESPWTLQKLGDHFGTSRERVRQLEKRALNKLKHEFLPLLEQAPANA
jgi:RNA polymerase sigma-32 factor